MSFFASIHCTSGKHCRTCRNDGWRGAAFRADMLARYPDLGQREFACPHGRKWGVQWGDVVERVAKPVAKALKLDCLDANARLKPESPCAKRKRMLNGQTL